MSGISTLMKKKPQRAPSPFPPYREELVIHEPGNGTSPDMESAHTIMLDFLASETVRNKCLLFKPTSL